MLDRVNVHAFTEEFATKEHPPARDAPLRHLRTSIEASGECAIGHPRPLIVEIGHDPRSVAAAVTHR